MRQPRLPTLSECLHHNYLDADCLYHTDQKRAFCFMSRMTGSSDPQMSLGMALYKNSSMDNSLDLLLSLAGQRGAISLNTVASARVLKFYENSLNRFQRFLMILRR